MHHDARAIQRFFQSLPSVLEVATISHLHLVHWPLNQWPLAHTLAEMGFAGTLTTARISTQVMAQKDGFKRIRCHDHPSGEEPASHILMELPQGKEAAKLAIEEALASLPPEGKLWLFGDKESGIQPLPKYWSNGHTILNKGHLKLVQLNKTSQWQDQPSKKKPILPTRVEGEPFYHYQNGDVTLATLPGLFSWAEPDAASLMLLQALQHQRMYHLLDWGCGCGLIGTTLAKHHPTLQVTLSDDMVRATRCSTESVRLNQLQARCQVILEDGIGPHLRNQGFDTIVTNPPFHRGQSLNREVALEFIGDAVKILERGGALWLVANSFLDYGPILQASFKKVETVLRDSRFIVWKAIKG
ncbi:16S rRNA m(2)G 1207 methyltransferase [Magnetococcus marinus MC-1]|uniref:16S rRNA m(2)G 1207 methyltransferase n=1 Tax=Magnetococcus marinus (strain ATCC BAA-1437 / JCM 17883 / MC-1) TaxID=156889 RepID=A0LDZ4_MAGMM|nr:methyltransferase [Magnetococcus marinus]ABK46187.1 16S rRNA m(2)G 1207 methyltransferase [Magnetococcus marinus MC-1]